ncbi:MAG: Fe-S protein assembly co-chaperone HscB [Magnetococcales bacterium]|nr:Fe-S protein assembly co-chaperone HscB [Magnetococcales bacterium]
MIHERECWSCGAVTGGAPFCPGCNLIQPPEPGMDPFALLALPRAFQVDRDQLDNVYRERQQQFHPDRFALRSIQERRYSLEQVTQLNEAWRTVRDPLQRGTCLLHLLRGEGTLAAAVAPDGGGDMARDPVFLMEAMEMREGLAEISTRSAQAGEQLAALRQDVERRIEAEMAALESLFSPLMAVSPTPETLEAVERHLNRLRYHQRFVEELDRLEEQVG